MCKSECERECECVLTRSLGHPHPGVFGAETGSALVRKLVGVRGFGGFHPQGWRRARVLLARELGAGTGTSLLQPSPAPGARRHQGGLHHGVWGSSLPKSQPSGCTARGASRCRGLGVARPPTPGCSRSTGTAVTRRSRGGSLGAASLQLLSEEALGAHWDRALLFLTDLGFPPEPREAAAVAFTPLPSAGLRGSRPLLPLSAFLPRWWRWGGAGPSVSPGPFHWQNPRPRSSWDFPLRWTAGRWGCPRHRLSHQPASSGGRSDPEGMYNPKQFCL